MSAGPRILFTLSLALGGHGNKSQKDAMHSHAYVGKDTFYHDQREVAFEATDAACYLHGDHPSAFLRTGLGSTNIASSDSGELPTESGFAGRCNDTWIGLYDDHARWYELLLGCRYLELDILSEEGLDQRSGERGENLFDY